MRRVLEVSTRACGSACRGNASPVVNSNGGWLMADMVNQWSSGWLMADATLHEEG